MNHRRLVIDMGNTRQKMGIFEEDELVHSETVFPDQSTSGLWESWKLMCEPDQIGLSSTVILSEVQQSWIDKNKVIQVNANLNFPFQILYKTPETLGQDRLAAVSAVYTLYSGKNVLVIDCGTCITYDFLTSDGHYIGGNIAPGIRMRLQSMYDYTDRLPLVDLPDQVTLLGQSTEEALQNGALGMAIMEAKGLIFYLREKYGHLTTVLTGGDLRYFENQLSGAYEVHADLVLSGLNEILKNNEI